MELKQIVTLFLNSNPKWARKLESITGQPTDYSLKCIDEFLNTLQKGPGLKSPENKLQEFTANYQLVMGLGVFKDYEAQILAADMSGFTLAEVAQHFRLHLGWDTNVEEIKGLYEQLLPKFKKIGREVGLFKDDGDNDSTEINNSIPNFGGVQRSKNDNGSLNAPPWKINDKTANQNNNIKNDSDIYGK